jgi:hypothetical protein
VVSIQDEPVRLMDIAMGFDCGSANFLRERGMKKETYPFDWNVALPGSIYKALQTNFTDVLLEENLLKGIITYKHKYDTGAGKIKTLRPLFDKEYGILYVHDWTEGVSLAQIKIKYERRFDRLIDKLSNSEEITIWNDGTDDSYRNKFWEVRKRYFDEDCTQYLPNDDITIHDVINLLEQKFPNTRFKLRYSHTYSNGVGKVQR